VSQVFIKLLGESKVEHFDLTSLIDHDVRWLYVAMDYASGVSFFEGRCNFFDYLQRPRQSQFAVDHYVAQRYSADQFHYQKRAPLACLAIVVKRRDARVTQFRNRPRLA